MDSRFDSTPSFPASWSDDLDPATRRARPSGNAVIDLEGVYLPDGDAPAASARVNGLARTVAFVALTASAVWYLIPPK